MLSYYIEYRKNILFIRLIGVLNKKTFISLDRELDNIINILGFYNIVFNFDELISIDSYSINELIKWYNLIKKGKGVSYVCGIHTSLNTNNLLKYIKEINNELCAIRVINWNN